MRWSNSARKCASSSSECAPLNGLVTITYTSINTQLSSLLTAVTGVAPGMSLAERSSKSRHTSQPTTSLRRGSTLNDFIKLVKAQTGKQLTPAQGTSFTTQANTIKTTLGC